MNVKLVIPGEPRAKGRPRFNRATGRAYTPGDTVSAEQRIQTEWIAAGRPELGPEPIALKLELVLARPAVHWNTTGLTPAGKRATWPVKKPDIDNSIKLALDALNGLAFVDDSQVVSLSAWRRWANKSEHAHTVIELWAMPSLEEIHG